VQLNRRVRMTLRARKEKMQEKDEFIYEYKGFTGKSGYCFIRVLNQKEKPLVVICSQMKINKTTTITNAVEYISNDIFHGLKQKNLSLKNKIKNWLFVEPWSKKIGDTKELLKKDKLVIQVMSILEMVAKISEQYKENKYRIENAIWIEHYSKELKYFDEDRYAIVTFHGERRVPDWYHWTIEEIAKICRYPIEEIEIKKEKILTIAST